MSKIFISHSVKDKEIADAFVDIILHGAMSIDLDDIFCTSTEGTKIKSGDDWRDSIKASLISSKVTLLIITPNYKESEMCMNEMGAAWVLTGKVLPTIVEPINFKTVGAIQEPKQIEKLLDESSLDRIRDVVQKKLEISAEKIKSDRWTQKKKEFIKIIKRHINDNPFSIPMDRNEYNLVLSKNDDFSKTIDNLLDEKKDLQNQIKDLEIAKSASEVKVIRKKYHHSSDYEDFKKLCGEISASLKFFKPIIRGILFKTYNSKMTKFDFSAYKEVIEDAEAEDYIDIDDDEGTVEANWSDTKRMRDIYSLFRKLESFIETIESEEFDEEYQKNFSAPLKFDNKSFWEEAFQLPIYLS